MVIYGGVDGTGVMNWPKYTETCANSFVKRIGKEWGDGGTYFRGPEYSGVATGPLPAALAGKVASQYSQSKGVVLAGHSRGAGSLQLFGLLEQATFTRPFQEVASSPAGLSR